MIPAFINSTILLLVSSIHVYWALGGRWGLSAALPERSGTKAFQPGRLATFTVAIIFASMSLFYLVRIGYYPMVDSWMPNWLKHYGLWLLASIFLLRAVGDFYYVGFFKRVHNSRFAELDTKFYSPLCLLLSANTLLLISFLS